MPVGASAMGSLYRTDDDRYQALFGQSLTTPLFGVEVPVMAHQAADRKKRTGAAMVCTFGDTTDVELGSSRVRPNLIQAKESLLCQSHQLTRCRITCVGSRQPST